jgi:hypothetical protein
VKKWWQLYKLEGRNNWFFYLIVSLLVGGWYLFLGLQNWGQIIISILSYLPFFLFPCIIIWAGFQSFRREWKQQTIYSLFSLPRSGWQIAGIKLAVAISFYLGLTLVAGGLLLVVNEEVLTTVSSQQLGGATAVSGWDLLQIVAAYWLVGAGLYITSQFSYLVSRIYARWRGIISILVFLLVQYLVIRGGSLLAVLFNWVPKITIKSQLLLPEAVPLTAVQLNLAPILGSVVIVCFIMGLSSWLLETQLEV